jgi:hypothetical protein
MFGRLRHCHTDGGLRAIVFSPGVVSGRCEDWGTWLTILSAFQQISSSSYDVPRCTVVPSASMDIRVVKHEVRANTQR